MVSDKDHVSGEAHLALNDCESAKADFEKTFQLDPENKVLVLFFFMEVNLIVFTILLDSGIVFFPCLMEENWKEYTITNRFQLKLI